MAESAGGIGRSELARLFREQAGKHGWVVPEDCFPTEIEGSFFPDASNLFRAFSLVAPNDVAYVILGQDPYPRGKTGCRDASVATGVAFGVRSEDIIPRSQIPSSSAIYKILAGIYRNSPKWNSRYQYSDLEQWAKDHRILLVNSALTVPRNGQPGSHLGCWLAFLRKVFEQISSQATLIAWGKSASDVYQKLNRKCDPSNVFDHPSSSGDFAEFWRPPNVGSKLSADGVR